MWENLGSEREIQPWDFEGPADSTLSAHLKLNTILIEIKIVGLEVKNDNVNIKVAHASGLFCDTDAKLVDFEIVAPDVDVEFQNIDLTP